MRLLRGETALRWGFLRPVYLHRQSDLCEEATGVAVYGTPASASFPKVP
jgi:hypothetical protein